MSGFMSGLAGADSDLVKEAAIIAAGGLAAVALAVYLFDQGGFGGDLSPEQALKRLEAKRAVLVDIRSLSEREATGIPDLRGTARGEYTAMPRPSQLEPAGRRSELKIGTVKEAESVAHALLVAGVRIG